MKLAIYAALASLACAFLNISFVAVRNVVVTNERKYSDTPLDCPSSYIGLENAVRDPNGEPPRPISNFPSLAAQINRSRPKEVYFEHNRHFTNFGTAYPTDRKFRVSSEVSRSQLVFLLRIGLICPQFSTIVQYRVQDWGMERCTLTLSTSLVAPVSGHHHGRQNDERPSGRVDIWKLDEGKRLHPQLLSWNTRPQRHSRMASWDLSDFEHLETNEFECKSGSTLTFEISCSSDSDDCRLEYNQTKERPQTGTACLFQQLT